jgi:EAL domain-containing protein (putative c-di-GMP-specific phosphodiesterase class I)
MATVLIVDDDPALLLTTSRLLLRVGHTVRMAKDLAELPEQLEDDLVDVVVTDLQLPDGDGPTVLRTIREISSSVPIVVITGAPSLDSAVAAVHTSAIRYLLKPVEPAELMAAVEEAGSRGAPEAALSARLTAGLREVWFAFQPIIDIDTRSPIAWEALMRGRMPGMSRPDEIVVAAARTGRVVEMGQRSREALALAVGGLPPGRDLYVNLHPAELRDSALYRDDEPMASIADRVVLEITERAEIEEITNIQSRIDELRERGYRIAIDDLGAGYSGLTALIHLKPDVVKLDMSLIRGLERSDTQRKVVRSVARMCADLGTRVVAEGVESQTELECLKELGVQWMQGFLFAKPAPEFPMPGDW